MKTTSNFESAVLSALTCYAETLGVTVQRAGELYRESESTQECIALLVLAQADPVKLQNLAKTLS
jgi:hypothetical protein